MRIIYHPLSLKAKCQMEKVEAEAGIGRMARVDERHGHWVKSIKVLDYVEGHGSEVNAKHLCQYVRWNDWIMSAKKIYYPLI